MSLRKARLADEIRDTVASCFQGGRMEDPRLQSVTITACKISPDLQVASVYYRVYLDEDHSRAQTGLDHAAGYFKQILSKKLKLRRVPSLRFFHDVSVEHGARIEKLLSDLKAH